MKRFMPFAMFACTLLLAGVSCRDTSRENPNVLELPVPPIPTPSSQEVTTTTVTMDAQNESGESGMATFTSLEETKTEVVVSVGGAPENVKQPAHLHMGTCSKIGTVTFPLNDVQNGTSTTILDVTLASILNATTPLALNIHKSVKESDIYVSCGDIVK